MCAFAARCARFTFRPAPIAICARRAICASGMKAVGAGILLAPIACGRKILYVVLEREKNKMVVQVKVFATLRRYVQDAKAGIPFEVELPDQATVADLIKQLGLPSEEVKVTFVNGRSRSEDWRLEPNDEVGIFPPIGGG